MAHDDFVIVDFYVLRIFCNFPISSMLKWRRFCSMGQKISPNQQKNKPFRVAREYLVTTVGRNEMAKREKKKNPNSQIGYI